MRAVFDRTGLLVVGSLAIMACGGGSTDGNSPPSPIPTVALTVNGSSLPPPIVEPGTASLTWSLPSGYLPDTTTCTAGDGWSGGKAVPGGSQALAGLSAGEYRFILSCTNDGTTFGADTATLVVSEAPPPDITPPTVAVTAPTNNQQFPAGTSEIVLTATTNEAATCKWGATDGAYAVIPNTFGSTGGTGHSTSIGGLIDSALYTRYIRCRDVAGNAMTGSVVATFSVANPPPTPTYTLSLGGTPTSGNKPLVVNYTLTRGGTATGTANDHVTFGDGSSQDFASSSGTVAFSHTFTGAGTFCAEASGSRQSISATSNQVCVTVNNPPPPPTPSVTLTVNGSGSPASVMEPATASLAWNVTTGYVASATQCRASGAWTGIKAVPTGSESINGLTGGTYDFVLTCSNDGFAHLGSDLVQLTVIPDSDDDGIPDPSDQCPTVAGPPPTGCPPLTVDLQDRIASIRDGAAFLGAVFNIAASGHFSYNLDCGNGAPLFSFSADILESNGAIVGPCTYLSPANYTAHLWGTLDTIPFDDTATITVIP